MDLTEILKECPKGIKLYSPIFGDVYLDKIRPYLAVVVTTNKEQNGFKEEFLYDGRYGINGECMLFPSKDLRDWDKWQRPFVDGDIIFRKQVIEGFKFHNIGIYKSLNNPTATNNMTLYCQLNADNELYKAEHDVAYDNAWRLAAKEEKQKLFKALEDNGYKWNPETKTLEKLIVPKFKVGDKIRHKLTGSVYKILFVLSNGYNGGVYDVAITNEIGKSIDIKEQDYYELVPNKFDPKTLKPFDKVLVRDFSNQKWTACLFSHIDNDAYHQFKTSTALGWYHCIPFNEDTKHLVGKMDEAPEFYRYWDE